VSIGTPDSHEEGKRHPAVLHDTLRDYRDAWHQACVGFLVTFHSFRTGIDSILAGAGEAGFNTGAEQAIIALCILYASGANIPFFIAGDGGWTGVA
jgi:hypothetical protein